MNMWEIKAKIVGLTAKLAFENDFDNQMLLLDNITVLQNMLTEKIAKLQVSYKYLKLEKGGRI